MQCAVYGLLHNHVSCGIIQIDFPPAVDSWGGRMGVACGHTGGLFEISGSVRKYVSFHLCFYSGRLFLGLMLTWLSVFCGYCISCVFLPPTFFLSFPLF